MYYYTPKAGHSFLLVMTPPSFLSINQLEVEIE